MDTNISSNNTGAAPDIEYTKYTGNTELPPEQPKPEEQPGDKPAETERRDRRYDDPDTGSVTVRSRGARLHCITVIGQIEGHYLLGNAQKTTKYEHLIPQLVAVDEDDSIDGILFIINTVGGDVEAGLALSEMIASMRKPTATLVIGGGHSIGVPLAVSARRSFIVPSATMTLHPVRVNGLMLGAQQAYDYLNRMQERIIRFIAAHCTVSEDRLHSLMMRTDEMATDMGTVLNGCEAVEAGLIDEVGGLSRACDWLSGEHNAAVRAAKSE